MRSVRTSFSVLILSAALLGTTGCGSDDGGSKSTANSDTGKCTPIGVECQTTNGFDEAVCRNADGTKLWYRVCTDTECKTGTDFPCNGTDCSDAAQPARDACNAKL